MQHSSVYCFTGFDAAKRQDLAEIIRSLGGQVSGSLTNHVTHLVCDRAIGDKYTAARKLNIKIVTSEYLTSYNKGDSRECHQCGDLQGLMVTTTGYSLEELDEIKQFIADYNGVYSAEMTPKTDLVIRSPGVESAKTKAAERWNIRMESKSYLKSLRNGFKSNMFSGQMICLGKGFDSALVDYLRKIVRFGGGILLTESNVMVTHFVVQKHCMAEEDRVTVSQLPNVLVITYQWLCDNFMSNELQPIDKYLVKQTSQLKANSTIEKRFSEFREIETMQAKKLKLHEPPASKGLFDGVVFRVTGFTSEETSTLIHSIDMNGGKITTDESIKFTEIRPFKFLCEKQNCYTEFWVEKCLQESQLVPVNDSVMYKPTHVKLPIPYFADKIVGLTGFGENERLWITRIVQCLGGMCTASFSQKNSHLVAKDTHANSTKLLKSKEWGIPIHDISWIYSFLIPGPSTKQSDTSAVSDITLNVIESKEKIPGKENRKVQIVLNDCETLSTTSGTPKLVEYGEKAEIQTSTLLDEMKVYMVSGISLDERETIVEMIERLGALVSHESCWTKTCSTLIISKPLKTEKYLCATAKCIPFNILT